MPPPLLRQPASVAFGGNDAGHGLVVPGDGRALAFAGEGDDFTKLLLGLRDGLRHGADGHLNWTFLQSEIPLKIMTRTCDSNMTLPSPNLASIWWTILGPLS